MIELGVCSCVLDLFSGCFLSFFSFFFPLILRLLFFLLIGEELSIWLTALYIFKAIFYYFYRLLWFCADHGSFYFTVWERFELMSEHSICLV